MPRAASACVGPWSRPADVVANVRGVTSSPSPSIRPPSSTPRRRHQSDGRRALPGLEQHLHGLGATFAVARRDVTDTELRPGGFVSGPSQFGLADAALWYLVFGAIGRIEPMALTSELSIRFLRPAQGSVLWAKATLESAGRRSVVGSRPRVVRRPHPTSRPRPPRARTPSRL